MEVTLATNSKLTSIAVDPMDNGLMGFEYYAEGIKFHYAWSVEVGPVVVKLTDRSKYTEKMAEDLGNIKGELGVMLGVKCCLVDNALPGATNVDGFLCDRTHGVIKRIVEIVGQNPGGDITFHWLNENLTVKGLHKAPSHLPSNQDDVTWVAEVPDDYWRASPKRLLKLWPVEYVEAVAAVEGVEGAEDLVGEIKHDTFSVTIRLVFNNV